MWLNRQQLADLFDRDIKTIGKHINNALKEELKDDNSVVANFATTAKDGKKYNVEYYNLLHGQDIYKSIEEKEANFLYLIVKNHVKKYEF